MRLNSAYTTICTVVVCLMLQYHAMPCHSNNKAAHCNQMQRSTVHNDGRTEQNVRFSDTFSQQCTTHIGANSVRCLFIVHSRTVAANIAEAPNTFILSGRIEIIHANVLTPAIASQSICTVYLQRANNRHRLNSMKELIDRTTIHGTHSFFHLQSHLNRS